MEAFGHITQPTTDIFAFSRKHAKFIRKSTTKYDGINIEIPQMQKHHKLKYQEAAWKKKNCYTLNKYYYLKY